MPSACVSKAVLGRNLSEGVEQAYVLWDILVFYGVSKKGELHLAPENIVGHLSRWSSVE